MLNHMSSNLSKIVIFRGIKYLDFCSGIRIMIIQNMDGFIIKYNNQKGLYFHNFVQFGKNGSQLCYRPSAHFVPFRNRKRPTFFYLTDNKMRSMSNILNHFDHSQTIFLFIYGTKQTIFHFVCVYLISQIKCNFSEHSLQFNWKIVDNQSL